MEEEVDLSLDNAIHDIVDILLDVFVLVLVGHIDVGTASDELDFLTLVEVVLGVGEVQTKGINIWAL